MKAKFLVILLDKNKGTSGLGPKGINWATLDWPINTLRSFHLDHRRIFKKQSNLGEGRPPQQPGTLVEMERPA